MNFGEIILKRVAKGNHDGILAHEGGHLWHKRHKKIIPPWDEQLRLNLGSRGYQPDDVEFRNHILRQGAFSAYAAFDPQSLKNTIDTSFLDQPIYRRDQKRGIELVYYNAIEGQSQRLVTQINNLPHTLKTNITKIMVHPALTVAGLTFMELDDISLKVSEDIAQTIKSTYEATYNPEKGLSVLSHIYTNLKARKRVDLLRNYGAITNEWHSFLTDESLGQLCSDIYFGHSEDPGFANMWTGMQALLFLERTDSLMKIRQAYHIAAESSIRLLANHSLSNYSVSDAEMDEVIGYVCKSQQRI